MKIRLLNGKYGELDIRPSSYPMRSMDSCRSKIQYDVGQLIKKKYPFDPILEDIYVPEGFYIDFFLPKRRLAFEIQGNQHNEFVPHFHKTEAKFKEAVARDAKKADFCRINDIKLILINSIKEFENL